MVCSLLDDAVRGLSRESQHLHQARTQFCPEQLPNSGLLKFSNGPHILANVNHLPIWTCIPERNPRRLFQIK